MVIIFQIIYKVIIRRSLMGTASKQGFVQQIVLQYLFYNKHNACRIPVKKLNTRRKMWHWQVILTSYTFTNYLIQ